MTTDLRSHPTTDDPVHQAGDLAVEAGVALESLLSVMGAFAEFERALIKERQREGVNLAKQRGVYKGRKKVFSAQEVAALRARAAAGEPKALIARDLGISRETLYRYLRG
jgi:DNA invertase Pin-like site-specific DNA recombinase